jgi:hypothetical protein
VVIGAQLNAALAEPPEPTVEDIKVAEAEAVVEQAEAAELEAEIEDAHGDAGKGETA